MFKLWIYLRKAKKNIGVVKKSLYMDIIGWWMYEAEYEGKILRFIDIHLTGMIQLTPNYESYIINKDEEIELPDSSLKFLLTKYNKQKKLENKKMILEVTEGK